MEKTMIVVIKDTKHGYWFEHLLTGAEYDEFIKMYNEDLSSKNTFENNGYVLSSISNLEDIDDSSDLSSYFEER